MRQLAFVILNPNQIPRIDPAVARLASEIMFGLGDTPTIGALAEHRPAWSRFIEWHDRRHIDPLKVPIAILALVHSGFSRALARLDYGNLIASVWAEGLTGAP
jgi:hypothetical protein